MRWGQLQASQAVCYTDGLLREDTVTLKATYSALCLELEHLKKVDCILFYGWVETTTEGSVGRESILRPRLACHSAAAVTNSATAQLVYIYLCMGWIIHRDLIPTDGDEYLHFIQIT